MTTDSPSYPARANNNNVYILGAGFSVDAGLPTIADFLNQMRDSADWLEEQGRYAELEAVNAVLKFRYGAAAAGYRVAVDLDNIEDLFSLAAALPEQEVSRHVQAAIGAALNYSHSHSRHLQARMRINPGLWALSDAWQAAATRISSAGNSEDVHSSVYHYYASVLAGLTSMTHNPNRNVVITFNYDLILEEAIEHLGIPFSYGLGSKSVTYDPTAQSTRDPGSGALFFLQLHGSLNWGMKDNAVPVFCSYDQTVKTHGRPHLVPPIWEKTTSGPTRSVWELALQALSTATRVIIVGFSFRPADAHFKYLLAAGLMQNSALRHIVIVNPRAAVLAPQIQSVLRSNLFDYGVIQLHPTSLLDFMNTPAALKSIGRPMIHDGIDLVDLGKGYLMKQAFL